MLETIEMKSFKTCMAVILLTIWLLVVIFTRNIWLLVKSPIVELLKARFKYVRSGFEHRDFCLTLKRPLFNKLWLYFTFVTLGT